MPEPSNAPESPVSSNSTVKVTVKPTTEPDLINFKVSNPVTYLRLWWKKVMSKEGIDLRFRIHPVTAILLASIISLGSFGLARSAVFSYIPILSKILVTPSPIPTNTPPGDWADYAVVGNLKITPNTNKYYLLTTSYIAISLQFKEDINLNKYLGKRILASGSYNQKTHTLIISDILDLELLPPSPVAVITPSPSPIPTPTASPIPTIEPTPTI